VTFPADFVWGDAFFHPDLEAFPQRGGDF
jgi:hypothetical protein